jgi:tetratricopeptide (TPR) repeat protein
MAVTLPLVLFLLDFAHERRVTVRTALEKAPFFAVAAVCAVVTVMTQQSAGAINPYPALSALERTCLPFFAVVFYFVKTIVPADLAAVYSLPLAADGFWRLALFVSPALVAAAAALLFAFRKKIGMAPVGLLFFFVTLLPVLQIIPVGSAVVADRYTYIPSVGIAVVAALLLRELSRRGVFARRASAVFVAVALIASGMATHGRCAVWKDSLTLWNDCVKKYPGVIAYYNRGAALSVLGKTDAAMADYDRAIALDPLFAKPWYNRGIAFLTQNRIDRAVADFSRAIALDPTYADALNNRGVVYVYLKEYDAAVADFSRAIEARPGDPMAWANRGIAQMAGGAYKRALSDFDRALAIDPKDAGVRERRDQAAKMAGGLKGGGLN